MTSAFFIYPESGKLFRLDEISTLLANFNNVCRDPNNPNGFIVAASRSECLEVQVALKASPNKRKWVVFLFIEPDVIQVYLEATSKVLESFKPVLENLLKNIDAQCVKDEEGREICPITNGDLISRLLE
jgi:hypothetical protein